MSIEVVEFVEWTRGVTFSQNITNTKKDTHSCSRGTECLRSLLLGVEDALSLVSIWFMYPIGEGTRGE